jgi:hypothetical protein
MLSRTGIATIHNYASFSTHHNIAPNTTKVEKPFRGEEPLLEIPGLYEHLKKLKLGSNSPFGPITESNFKEGVSG